MTLTGLCNTFCGNITTTLQYHRKNIISFTITKRYTEKVEKTRFSTKKTDKFHLFSLFCAKYFFIPTYSFFLFLIDLDTLPRR